ncbi:MULTISPECIES: hypothetical protein [Streptomyces]|uniref:DUF8108 domain-containing protein n=1 Tax=Streptomyces clavifer TaxID=68188 RepID=A0ABS4VCR5_9ACTN|nr:MULTISPECIES: hypothetical protein [Streptomyces]MBP2361598.1 hypothetical protein [Streptomyces clavifer]MDX2744024.1 hypothetical protein [Streptomyces sp. NRRL_B-2557]WRY81871.1 hypothetical protein OG388_11815 [Streptomyces clavifer]WUC27631.1 hypothetical protein OG927_09715 [Streptomyces clavifer]GHA91651.1 hypothetical protein GCM10010392_17530 [Streptomyces clavifer]
MKPRGAPRGEVSIQPPPGYYGAGGAEPDAAQRGLILDWVVSRRIAAGWRVESRSGSQAVLVRGQPLNHVLHALLTVFSCCAWGLVWAVLAATNKVERIALTVDAQGQVVTVGAP